VKYKDLGDSDEEELMFSTKKVKPKVVYDAKNTGKVGSEKSLVNMIEKFTSSLIDSEVEEQYLTFDEFIKLPFR
jgi:hypothetical protein